MFINLRLECKLSIKRKSSQDSNQNLVKKSRLFGIEVAFRRRQRNMAIAFFVPPEYGPVVPQQQEQVPVRVVHHGQDANNNNVRNNNVLNNLPPDNPTTRGLISIFVDEILSVINRATTNQTQSLSQPTQSNNTLNQQDNQNVDGNEGVYGYFRHLPDIVTCHAGMSVRCGSGRPIPERLSVPSLPNTGDSRGVVVPLSPRSNVAPACDFEVSLKLDLTLANSTESLPPPVHDDQVQSLPHELEYRMAGAHLRHIADNYTLQRSRNVNQSTFELNVVISVALPAAAIIGLAIAYLRRC
ncbi:unnamed protein product [Orchesella dallaii]|uniref:Uncharacterized protein n=1 Tax=Orchesella dallaii TaxID=48710 RepID=A0ABP1Q862_9HEXA